MARRRFVAGNWKMNKDPKGARELVVALQELLRTTPASAEVAVCPPHPALDAVSSALAGSAGGGPAVALGAQNMSQHDDGAYTGEVSASMLRAVGCRYVILGHSERRQHYGEDDAIVNAKMHKALASGLVPIVCVGETLAEREAGRTAARVEAQVKGSLAGITPDQAAGIVLAYEPVWAIGTGKTATPEQASEVHRQIRALLGTLFGAGAAEAIRILYGGSVNAGNAAQLFAMEGIDGGLIGGASLKADSFHAICTAGG